MRPAALLLAALAGCTTTEEGPSPLLPTEFHVFYTVGDGDGSGSLSRDGGHYDSKSYSSSSDVDYQAVTAGLTWGRLFGPSKGELAMQRAARAMTIAANMMAAREQPPPAITFEEIQVTVEEEPDPEPEQEPTPEEPVPVTLESASADVWTPLISAMTTLALAVAAYLGRRRLPLVGKKIEAREKR
jgi:hypothetical protein